MSRKLKLYIASFIIVSVCFSASLMFAKETTKTATFAGGCFWCTEATFQDLPGIVAVYSGYSGGHVENPSYGQVSSGYTGHYESIQIHYNPAKISYTQLLDKFWREIDPTDNNGQFADRGTPYRTAIFFHDKTQEKLAQESKKKLAASKRFTRPIVTPILPAGPFYKAEDYHQDYYKKHPFKYKYYRSRSGRDTFLEKTWGLLKKKE